VIGSSLVLIIMPWVRPSTEMFRVHVLTHVPLLRGQSEESLSWTKAFHEEKLLLDCPLICLFKQEAMKRGRRYHLPVTLVITQSQKKESEYY
jgi:hypothetical protein